MEPPKPTEQIVLMLKEDECPYSLKFGIESESLVIDVSEQDSVPSINYNAKYALSDLVKQNRYFKLFETFEELMPEIKNLSNENKIQLKKGKSSVNIILKVPVKTINEVYLTIPQAKFDNEKVIAELCSTVNELKREIKILKSTQITEEQLNLNLQSKDILLNEEEKKMVCDWILKRMKSEGKKVNMTLLYKLFHSAILLTGLSVNLLTSSFAGEHGYPSKSNPSPFL